MREDLGSSGREYVNTSSVDSPTLQTIKTPAPPEGTPHPPAMVWAQVLTRVLQIVEEAKFQV